MGTHRRSPQRPLVEVVRRPPYHLIPRFTTRPNARRTTPLFPVKPWCLSSNRQTYSSVWEHVIHIQASWPKVHAVMQEYNLPLPKYRTCAEGGLIIACTAYRHVTDIDHQATLALYTFCMLIADDDYVDLQVLKEFVPRFYTRQSQLHPFLNLFMEVLTIVMPKYYDSYGANSIVSGSMDWYNAEMLLRTNARLCSTPDE